MTLRTGYVSLLTCFSGLMMDQWLIEWNRQLLKIIEKLTRLYLYLQRMINAFELI